MPVCRREYEIHEARDSILHCSETVKPLEYGTELEECIPCQEGEHLLDSRSISSVYCVGSLNYYIQFKKKKIT